MRAPGFSCDLQLGGGFPVRVRSPGERLLLGFRQDAEGCRDEDGEESPWRGVEMRR